MSLGEIGVGKKKGVRFREYLVIVVVIFRVGSSAWEFRQVAEYYFGISFKDLEGRNLLCLNFALIVVNAGYSFS